MANSFGLVDRSLTYRVTTYGNIGIRSLVKTYSKYRMGWRFFGGKLAAHALITRPTTSCSVLRGQSFRSPASAGRASFPATCPDSCAPELWRRPPPYRIRMFHARLLAEPSRWPRVSRNSWLRWKPLQSRRELQARQRSFPLPQSLAQLLPQFLAALLVRVADWSRA